MQSRYGEQMQISIHEKKEEPLLSRSKIVANVEFEQATPSYKDVTTLIANQLKADEKQIAIRHIYNDFGHKKAQIIAYIYSDETKKNSIEPKVKAKTDAKAPKKE